MILGACVILGGPCVTSALLSDNDWIAQRLRFSGGKSRWD